MPLETYHHRSHAYHQWRDGVRPTTPVPRIDVRATTQNWQRWKLDASDSSTAEAEVRPMKKEPSFFLGSVPSVDGEKPPRWLLPLIMVTMASVPGLALVRYYHLWS